MRGGEDYAFEGLSVRVIPSLHGVLRRAPNRRPDPNASWPPAIFPRDAKIEGLRPDVALIGAMPERREICQYTARLLRALGNPRMVLPTHWDRFNVTYDVAQDAAVERLQTFLAEVKAASPDTKVVVPKYFEPVVIP